MAASSCCFRLLRQVTTEGDLAAPARSKSSTSSKSKTRGKQVWIAEADPPAKQDAAAGPDGRHQSSRPALSNQTRTKGSFRGSFQLKRYHSRLTHARAARKARTSNVKEDEEAVPQSAGDQAPKDSQLKWLSANEKQETF